MIIDLEGCARCDGDGHPALEFRPLTRPAVLPDGTAFTHWAPCPTNGEPILMLIVDKDVAEVAAQIAEGCSSRAA